MWLINYQWRRLDEPKAGLGGTGGPPVRGSLGSQGHSIRNQSGVREGNLHALQLAGLLLLLLALPLLELMINDLTGMSHHLSTDFHSSLSQDHLI